MRFWNWRPWPVRGRKKTLLLSGRFGNDGIGQVPSKSQRVTVFLEWSLLTRQKSTTLKRSSGGKDVKKFGALVYISLVLLHWFGKNHMRHQFAAIPATENSEIGTDSSHSFEKLGLNWIYPPPTPSPIPHSHSGSFRDLPGKNEIPTSPRFSASTQHLVGGWSSIGVWGFGV